MTKKVFSRYKFWCKNCERWDTAGDFVGDGHNCSAGTGDPEFPPDFSQIDFFRVHCLTCRQDVDMKLLNVKTGYVAHVCDSTDSESENVS